MVPLFGAAGGNHFHQITKLVMRGLENYKVAKLIKTAHFSFGYYRNSVAIHCFVKDHALLNPFNHLHHKYFQS